jgi:hypothetical protein
MQTTRTEKISIYQNSSIRNLNDLQDMCSKIIFTG